MHNREVFLCLRVVGILSGGLGLGLLPVGGVLEEVGQVQSLVGWSYLGFDCRDFAFPGLCGLCISLEKQASIHPVEEGMVECAFL